MGLNVDQELFGVFAFYSAILIVKMMSMAFLTARCVCVWGAVVIRINLKIMIDVFQAEIPHWQPRFPGRCSNCWQCILIRSNVFSF